MKHRREQFLALNCLLCTRTDLEKVRVSKFVVDGVGRMAGTNVNGLCRKDRLKPAVSHMVESQNIFWWRDSDGSHEGLTFTNCFHLDVDLSK